MLPRGCQMLPGGSQTGKTSKMGSGGCPGSGRGARGRATCGGLWRAVATCGNLMAPLYSKKCSVAGWVPGAGPGVPGVRQPVAACGGLWRPVATCGNLMAPLL